MYNATRKLDQGTARSYETPRLQVLGKLVELTASGSVGATERGTQPSCNPDEGRRPCF